MKQLFTIVLLWMVSGSLASDTKASPSEWVSGKGKHSRIRLISELAKTGPESSDITLGIEIELEKNWYTYWKNPGDVGLAPKVKWMLPEGWTAESLAYPIPEKHQAPSEKALSSYGYQGSVLYPVKLAGPAPLTSDFKLEAEVDYLVCEKICVPQTAQLKLQLPRAAHEIESEYSADLVEAVAGIPLPTEDFQARWIDEMKIELNTKDFQVDEVFLYSPELSGSFWSSEIRDGFVFVSLTRPVKNMEILLVQKTEDRPVGMSVQLSSTSPLKADGTESLLWALVLALIGGLILNLMPCVLPVLLIKTTGLMELRAERRHPRSALVPTIAGILVSFIALGALTGSLRFAGEQIGWGFQFQVPGFVTAMILLLVLFGLNLFSLFEFGLPTRLTTRLGSQPGAFFEGVFATLLSTPCSAPFLGTALSFGLSRSWTELLLIFFTMGLGLSLPYVVLLVRPEFLKFLPRPGAWMDSLKRILAYGIFLTALWLFYVLLQQTKASFAAILLLVILGAFILIKEFKSIWRWVFVLALAVFSIVQAKEFQIDPSLRPSKEIVFSEDEFQKALAEGKTVFIHITADWCLTCQFNESNVIKQKWFKALLEERQVEEMRVDWTNRNEEVARFLEKYGRVGIPFAMIANSKSHTLFPELMTQRSTEEILKDFFKD